MDKLLNSYINDINREHSTGKSTEHTFRPALKKLIECISDKLTATNEPKRKECGAPDYVITRKNRNLVETIGYIEAKDIGSNLTQVAKTEQIKKRYLPSLNNFILTDYIEFRWYVNEELRETASLGTEQADEKFKATPDGLKQVGNLLKGFISQEPEKIGSSKYLAARLAHMARLLRDLIEKTFGKEKDTDPLHGQFKAFEKVLLHDLKEDQFADMYAQTICYGLFAARCYIEEVNLFGKDKHAVFHGLDYKPGEFTREHAGWMLPKTNPFLQKMFNEITGPGLPDQISWLVDDIVALLRNCQMADVLKGFAKQTKRQDPVIHFYETFLAEYDPALREQRGVYYTPEPVVSYIVRSVDHILKDKFGLKSGLADKSKIQIPVKGQSKKQKTKDVAETRDIHKLLILDPATGTGTFLYEVIEQIYKTFKKDKGAWSSYVKEHLLPRIYGFELMMAPYTIAHMKLGLQLAEKGYDFKADERLKIFLTNTLEEAEDMSDLPLFTQWLAEEARQANEVKRDLPIMVVLGNPPYSNFGMLNKGDWITSLLKDYKKGLNEKKLNLDDDFIKFIRFAQWRIEQTGSGVLAFITNNTYLDGITHRRMRKSLMECFSEIYVLDLHGSTKKKETCPDGSKDVNVFDIQQGVSIAIFIKKPNETGSAKVYHKDLFGQRKNKYQWLNKESINSIKWTELKPKPGQYFFIPKDFYNEKEYLSGIELKKVFKNSNNGIKTDRDSLFIDISKDSLASRIQIALNQNYNNQFRDTFRIQNSSSYKLVSKLEEHKFNEDFIRKCLYRPYDDQWIYFSRELTSRPAWEVTKHILGKANYVLLSCRQQVKAGFQHVFCTNKLSECCSVSNKTREITTQFPLYLYPTEKKQGELFGSGEEEKAAGKDGRRANLSDEFIDELKVKAKLEYLPDGRGDLQKTFGPEDVLAYIYAVLHSPAYRKRYEEFLKIDFPRIPLPDGKVMFRKFAQAGFELMGLHLMEADILEDKEIQPTYPVEGSNEVEKGYPKYVADAAAPNKARVYINKDQYFEGVRLDVWEFHVGGYQVCEKWLKDRRDRTLSYDDIEHYKKITIALSQTLQLINQKFLNEPWEQKK